MRPDCRLICFELSNDFIAWLAALNDPRLYVYNACASSIRRILDGLSIQQVDHIVSSLPLALLDDAMLQNILHVVDRNLA